MTSASVSAYALGIAIPIPGASGSGKGDTTGSVDNVSLGTFRALGKIFVIAGTATGPGGGCDGQVLIVLDDVDALFTLLGGGGLALAILMLGAILLTSRSAGCLSKVLCTVFGGLGAIGLGLSLEQFQVIEPTSPVGLVIVLAGAILGLLLASRNGFFGGGPAAPATVPPVAPPTAPVTPPVATPPTPPADPAPTDDVGKGAADLLGDAATSGPDTVGGSVAGGVGSSGGPAAVDKPMDFYDAAKTAADILDAPAPPAPGPVGEPPDPNAPGVDIKDPSR